MGIPAFLALTLFNQSADSARVRVHVTSGDQPLESAVVGAGTVRVRTGRSGTAELRLVAPGEHRLIVVAVGYKPDTLGLILGSGTRDTLLSVVLEPEAEELEELIVESTRSNRRVEEQPLRVEVLAREEIEEKLLMTPGDISMMLNETGGLRVQTTSPSLGGAMVRVQGLRGRYTLVLADGLPLYGQAGGLGLLQIPPMDLGQVEVIKGASSALYGGSALGGVINLVSRRPPDTDPVRELLLNATTLGGADLVGFTAGRLNPAMGYTLLAGGHAQGRRDRDGDGWADLPGYERLVLRPRLTWSDAAGRSLFLTAGSTLEQREGGTLDGRTAPDGLPFPETLRTTRVDAGGLARLPLGSTLATIRMSGMTQGHRHGFGQVRETDRHSTWFAEGTLGWSEGGWVLVVGAALQGERYRSDGLEAFDYDYAVPGVFAQAEAAAADRISLAASARVDHHSRYGTFFNPRLSVRYVPRPGWSLRASAGTGFYGPTPFTEETEVTGLSRLQPVAGLEAEKARSGSLDLQRLAGPLELNLSLFGSIVDGAVQLRDDPDGSRLVNAPAATRTWGTDLVVRYRREPFGLTGSYTWTRTSEPDPDRVTSRRAVPLTPRHGAGLVGVYEREGRARVGLELYYTGEQLLDDPVYRETSRPYLIAGVLGEWRIGRARLFLNLENLGGVRQTRYAPLVRPTRAPDGRWTTDVWAPLDGRVINGGARVSF